MNYWKLLLLLAFASPALADDDALLKCRDIDDNDKRLACFDEYVGMRFLTVEQIEEESAETVTAVTKSSAGRLTITLENGQVWRQSDSKSFRISVGDAVVVRAKSLGSFMMSKEGSSRSIRVKRAN